MKLPLHKIDWDSKGNEKLELFLSCPADEVFFGGAVGGGKTEGLMIASLGDSGTGFFDTPSWKCLVLRRTYPELEATLVRRSAELLGGKADYSPTHKTWTSPKGGLIRFGHVNNEDDVVKYQSTEWTRIEFDELSHFTERMYLYFFSRLRTVDPRIRPTLRSASNPGGIGHAWIKKRFMEEKEPLKIYKDVRKLPDETQMEWSQCFIPATVFDNKLLIKNSPSYLRALLELPDVEREAFLYGNWDIFSGQFFSDFTEDHICDDFEIPVGWPVYISMDWGFATRCAVGFYAEDPESKTIYRWNEIYTRKVEPRLMAQHIKLILGHHFAYLKNRSSDKRIMLKNPSNVSTHDEFSWEGIYWEIVDHDRIEGWHRCHEMFLKDKEGQVRFKVMRKCQNFIRLIPLMIHDTHRPEDMERRGECHIADEFRYFCISKRGSEDLTYTPMQVSNVTGYFGKVGDDQPLRRRIKRLQGLDRSRNFFVDRKA